MTNLVKACIAGNAKMSRTGPLHQEISRQQLVIKIRGKCHLLSGNIHLVAFWGVM
jgi:hypothetical protein